MIKDLFIRQKQFFSNLSLKKKFMSIIIALGDSVLQENLAIADDPDATYIDKNNAFTALGSAVPNYYYNFKDGTGMRYISLYNDSYVSRSDYVLSANVAPERIRH